MALYEHSKKAGNAADVWKHFVLLTVVEGLTASPPARAFHYRETHCGAGGYALGPAGEWRQGIGRILPVAGDLAGHPYFRFVGERPAPGDGYPGSWRLVARLLEERRVRYRMTLCDTSPSVHDRLCAEIAAGRVPATVDFHATDGYRELRRSPAADLTLIDPPYRPARRDWLRGRTSSALLTERGESYLLWYPIFWPTQPQRMVEAAAAPSLEVQWLPLGRSSSQTLKGCGMVAGGRTAAILEAARPRLGELAELLGGRFSVRR